MPIDWQTKFAAGLDYAGFLEQHGQPGDRRRWQEVYERTVLSDAQRALLEAFTREMNVLCLAGAWCGDCVDQCPIFQRFAEAGDRIHLRFLDRDVHPEVQAELSINAGNRVPVVVFLAEDFCEVARYGERTLARYRQLTRQQLGQPLGGADADVAAAVVGEWLDQFERVQWLLRLSPRLRQRHGD
jgi:thiol-disulfide isomerase/thioredoxin